MAAKAGSRGGADTEPRCVCPEPAGDLPMALSDRTTFSGFLCNSGELCHSGSSSEAAGSRALIFT
jgi:hypothetical protein